ncbi:hypothetical protein HCY58_15195 [Acinetobacter radioresistens]|uniref:hypothetical protein n=1 Tax=Acinetobacter radioresistens TaxID=40216 RepID=UPI002004D1F8|nr:hypothetical protein [Acinetobacter radioresistens]MCK4088383.1 hypothetical protein [Acinetobacter radioresistens]
MKICIGGDLDGQVVECSGLTFKAQDIGAASDSEYRMQSYIMGKNRYEFWIDTGTDLHEATKRVEKIIIASL